MKIPFKQALEFMKGAELYMVNYTVIHGDDITIDTQINPPYFCIEGHDRYEYVSTPLQDIEFSPETGELEFNNTHGNPVVITVYNAKKHL